MSLSNIGGAEPSTVTFRVATVTQARGSTTEHQEIVVLGGESSSLAIAAVLDGAPGSTAWGLTVRQVGYSTTVQVSSVAGTVTISGGVSLSNLEVIEDSAAAANPTGIHIIGRRRDSLAGETSADADNVAINATDKGEVYVKHADAFQVSSVAGTVTAQIIGPLSSAAPAAGDSGVIVRQVGYSTTVNVSSLAGKVLVDQNSTVWSVQVSSVAGTVAAQIIGPLSSAAPAAGDSGVIVRQVGYSTTVNVSSLAGKVLVDQNSTVWPVQVSSVAGAVQARQFTSSGGSLEGSTATPTAGVLGLHVRPAPPAALQSTSILANIGTAGGSTALLSSAAGLKWRVAAFSVMSTVVAVSSCAFASSNKERWGLLLGTGSSGITGANLAIGGGLWLFETDAAEALNFTASSTGLYRVSLTYWQEP